MSSSPVRQTHPFIARLIAVLLVATGVPVLVAAAGPGAASAAPVPGSTPDSPIQVTGPSAVPAGATPTGSTATGCATTSTWTHTVPAVAATSHPEFRYARSIPAVAEVNHTEYRWPLLKRTYTPAQAEESYQVYSYKKTVQDYKTDHQKQKQVKGKVYRSSDRAYVRDFGFEFWQRPTWNTSGSFFWESEYDGRGLSGTHGATSYAYTESGVQVFKSATHFQYALNGVTRQIPNGSHEEFSGERTTTLGSPWVLLAGYPKKVVTKAAVPASFSPWVADGASPWSTSSAAPVDPDGQTGDTNPANLRMVGSPREQMTVVDSVAVPGYTEFYVAGGAPSRDRAAASWILQTTLAGWTRFEERSVSNNDAKPAVVTYYAYNDQKICETVVPTATPTPTTEVLGEQGGRATGRLYTSCQRTVRVTMKNNSSRTVTYKVIVGKKATTMKVKAESTRIWTTTGQHRAVATLMMGNKVLAKKKVPGACSRPEVLPETGSRH